MAYSKLHSSLVNSSLWTEQDHVRILFITLLALCDKDGCVYGSRPGLERAACIDLDASAERDPWEVLMSPDSYSCDKMRAPENEGRRIEEIPGGFRLLNFAYYRGLRNDDDRAEQNRRAQAKHKQKLKDEAAGIISQDKPWSAEVSQDKPAKAHTEAETEAETEIKHKKRKTKPLTTIPEDFEITPSMRDWFTAHCPRINIEQETAKFKERCLAKGTEYKDWVAGWRTQMLNAEEWSKKELPVAVANPKFTMHDYRNQPLPVMTVTPADD